VLSTTALIGVAASHALQTRSMTTRVPTPDSTEGSITIQTLGAGPAIGIADAAGRTRLDIGLKRAGTP
jgi:hypothetical protein